jgi:hypothetical protein
MQNAGGEREGFFSLAKKAAKKAIGFVEQPGLTVHFSELPPGGHYVADPSEIPQGSHVVKGVRGGTYVLPASGSFKVHGDQNDVAGAWAKTFGDKHPLTHDTAAAIVGADPSAYHVEVKKSMNGGVMVTAWNGSPKTVFMLNVFGKTKDGLVCDFKKMEITAPRAGLGRSIIARQVAECQKLGVKEIRCNAERADDNDPPSVGYQVWPKFGYDAPFDARERLQLPGVMAKLNVRTVQQLMARPGGKEWWAKHGWSKDMVLDLDPHSAGMKRFHEYMTSKQ